MSAAPDPDARRARARLGAGAALVLVLVGLGVAVFVTAVTPHGGSSVVAPSATSTLAPAAGVAIYVHVLGAVEAPGLYELQEGDRAVDAIAAAGGMTAEADPAGVNLARFVVDGEQLVVPVLGAAPPPSGSSGGPSSGLVNLNTADAATLDTLPGIGPALADRIIAWREANGPFRSVDDLLEVSGIGESKLEALDGLVTV